MPFRRKYVRRRRYIRRRKGMSKPIRKVMRAVRQVKKQGSQIIWLRNRLVPTPIGDATYSAPFFYSINNLNDSNPIFGTVATDLDSDTYYHRRTQVQVKFNANNETDATNYTIMLVRLTKYAIDRYSMSNGGLNNLTPDLHYTVNPGGGTPGTISQASTFMLNPKFFKILYVKRFHTVSSSTAPSLTDGTQNFYWTKTFTINSKYKMHNPGGDAKNLEACSRPENNWFIIAVSAALTPVAAASAPYIACEEVSSWTTST